MKLELKHLANYLPYGLKFIHKSVILQISELKLTSQWKVWANNLTKYNRSHFIKNGLIGKGFIISQVKPLLLPSSELITPLPDGTIPLLTLYAMSKKQSYSSIAKYEFIKSWGKNMILRHHTSADSYNEFIFDKGSFYSRYVNLKDKIGGDREIENQIHLFEYLFANHFDVYELIDAGLAIDKRTII